MLALLGENGAGRSTLIKILGGAQLPDQGSIEIDGRETSISSPHVAQREGIGIIFQEFNLVPALTAAENIRDYFSRNLFNYGRLLRELDRPYASC